MTKPTDSEVKIWFEENYLDGDKIQSGQSIFSSECLDAILQALSHFGQPRKMTVEELEVLAKDYSFGNIGILDLHKELYE